MNKFFNIFGKRKPKCKNCKYWDKEETDQPQHLCNHPEIGGDMISHNCWGDWHLFTNPEFGCILFKKKSQVQ